MKSQLRPTTYQIRTIEQRDISTNKYLHVIAHLDQASIAGRVKREIKDAIWAGTDQVDTQVY